MAVFSVRSRVLTIMVMLVVSMLWAMPTVAQDAQTHVVERGENLFRIALRYGVDMDALARANNIRDTRRIFAGQTLVIPGLSAPNEPAAVNNNPLIATAPITHVVQRGEILSRIAQRYGVTVAAILAANDIPNPNRIEVGDVLQIWTDDLSTVQPSATTTTAEVSAPVPEPVASTTTHVVQRGEHLSGIARRYGVRWTAIAELNGISDPNRVFAGMTLRIPTSGSGGGLGIVSQSVEPASPRWGTGREIVVVLSTQMVYAFEDGVLQYSALSSTGLPATPTVRGDFNVWHKTRAQTMSGPGYYLPNVEWVVYFYQGYGLHGTYWHSNFGQPMSRGCVNLTNADAEWFYNFASIGTPVHVRW